MTEQNRQDEIRRLNETPLSKAAEPLVKKSYLAEHDLILTAALMEYLDEAIPEETGIWKYQMQTAREVIESLESWIGQKKYSPKTVYEFLTTTEDEDDWTEAELLKLVQKAEPGSWILGALGQELMGSLSVWFNLNP